MTGDILLQTPGILEVWGNEPKEFEGSISTDTRSLQKGQAYLALNGEQHRGIKFADKALKAGASLVITDLLKEERETLEKLHKVYPQVPILIVENANKYFQDTARLWATQWRKKDPNRILIGLTGSNGKTTTKEMLRELLVALYPERVLATEGNLNNQFGVPMTLLRLNDDVDVGVIEMGTNQPGEIEILAKIVDADAGLITNIGPAHLEFLGNLEGVFHEKISLYKVFASSQWKKSFCINSKDPYLKRLEAFADVTPLRPSEDESLEEREYKLTGSGMLIRLQGKTHTIENPPLQGQHNWENLGLSLLLLSELFPQKTDALVARAQTLKLPKMNRGNWVFLGDKTKLYQDAYNANPDSLKASFQTFLEAQNPEASGKLLLILGDMNELGQESARYHRETAEWIDRQLKDRGFEASQVEAIFIGSHSENYNKGFTYSTHLFSDTKKAIEQFPYTSQEWSGIFLKGSRSLQLESIVDIFKR